MIVFFDSTVHVDIFSGSLSLANVVDRLGMPIVRLSPVVASELLRGARRRAARRQVEKLVSQLLPIEPPSWRTCWFEVGRLLPRVFKDHEGIGLARLQNDCLLALTARHTGAQFVSADPHFATIARHVDFRVRFLAG